MAFRLPAFNMLMNIWHGGSLYANPADVVVFGNLAYGRRVNVLNEEVLSSGLPTLSMTALLPPLTDVRGANAVSPGDILEAPAGSGRVYAVVDSDDIGKGFTNEHRAATLLQLTSGLVGIVGNPWLAPLWPTPTP